MKRFIIILMLFLFVAIPVQGKEYTTTVGDNWLIKNADLRNCTGLSGNTWIETLIRLPGDLFYVDSNASGEATGLNWTDAVTTINAANALCANDNGDLINVAPGHTGTDGAEIDVRGVTVYGWGNGENLPLIDYDTNTDKFVIGADDVTIINLTYKANVPDVAKAIDVEAGVENFSIINCRFYVESTTTDEFTDTIITNAGCDNGKIINCDIEMGAGNAASAINTIGSDYLLIKDCRISGDYSVANIEDSGTASIWITIQDNILVNGTVGGAAGLNDKPVITLKVDTSAVIVNNTCITNVDTSDLAIVAADGFLAGNTYNETEGGLANAAGIGLIAGKSYSVALIGGEEGNLNLFDVAGGPILITSFSGLITETIGGAAETTKIIFDGVDDFEFSTAVDITGIVRGSRILFSAANPAVLTPIELGGVGSGNLMEPWFCPVGMIEVVDTDSNGQDGITSWYMTFIPLTQGVTVTPQ